MVNLYDKKKPAKILPFSLIYMVKWRQCIEKLDFFLIFVLEICNSIKNFPYSN